MNKFIIIIFLSFIFIILNIANASDSLEDKLKRLQQQERKQKQDKETNLSELIKLASKIEYEKDKQKTVAGELNSLDKNIADQNLVILELAEKIDELNASMEILKNDITDLQQKLDGQKETLSKRIRTIYKEYKKNSEFYIFLHLLEAENLTELRKRLKFANVIAAKDRLVIDNILYSLTELSLKKKEFEEIKEQQQLALNEHQQLKDKYLRMRADKEKMLDSIFRNQNAYQREIENRRRQMKVIEAAINNLLLEQKQTAELIELSKLDFKKKKGRLPWPIKRARENQIITGFSGVDSRYKFQMKNDGIEIRCIENQNIFSVADGVVLFAGWLDSFGFTVIISHGGGYLTLYAHLNTITVTQNQKVATGALIGKAGDTGSLVGTSLFFQIREDRKTIDPEIWLVK